VPTTLPPSADDPLPLNGEPRRATRPAPKPEPIVPVPADAPDATKYRHLVFGTPAATYRYEQADGRLVGVVWRWNNPDGSKRSIAPGVLVQGSRGPRWRAQGLPTPTPLYRLAELAAMPANAPVLVVEGEKAADAASIYLPQGAAVAASIGGSGAAGKSDWSALQGRCVTIWRDNDDAGARYAAAVAELLKPIAAGVTVIELPPGLPAAWDLADQLPPTLTAAAVRAIIAKALAAPAQESDSQPASNAAALVDRVVTEPPSDPNAFAFKKNRIDGRGPTHADMLLELAQSAELFHSPNGTGFADLDINGHRETWPIRSKGFRRWLARGFFEATQGAPSSEALQSALTVIEAKAQFDAPERVVYVRVGGLNGRLYLDLGDETWRAVEIDATGWRLIGNPSVRFRRAAGMQPLPVPEGGGSIKALRSFLNVKSDADFVLVVAWVLACLRNRGPYPVMVLSGEQGSAKSTFSTILRALLDPNTAPLRALPREDRDLFIAASNGHVLAFDNVSGLPAWISDTLCRLATGGGFAVRQLYTDQDEVLFDATRPVILNGIEDIVTRPDLADRAVLLTLEPIPEERRRSEAELWTAFEAERPRILGALLDAVAQGLRMLPETRLEKLPRMADFALWATACETALWPAGTFWSAYCGNRDEAVEGAIDADPVAASVRALMATRTAWTGTASDLLGALAGAAGDRAANSKAWPDNPRALAGRLRRAATFLRKVGIEMAFEREGRARTRTIKITTTPITAAPEMAVAQPSASSASSAPASKPNPSNGLPPAPSRTVGDDTDGRRLLGRSTVHANPLKPNDYPLADGADANFPSISDTEERAAILEYDGGLDRAAAERRTGIIGSNRDLPCSQDR